MTHNEQLREQIENTLIANVCALNHVTGGAAAVKEIPIPGTEHVMLIGSRAEVARFLDAVRSAAREQARNEALEPERMSTDEAREYLVKFMEQHFTDKTFHRYIRGEHPGGGLAGDFAWQMARALKTEAPAASKEGDNRE